MDLIKVMKFILVFSALAIGYLLIMELDYTDLSWDKNRSVYGFIIPSSLTMVAMISTLRQHKKSTSDSK